MIGPVCGDTVDVFDSNSTPDGLVDGFCYFQDATTKNHSYVAIVQTTRLTGLRVAGAAV